MFTLKAKANPRIARYAIGDQKKNSDREPLSRFLKFWYIIDPAWNSKPATSQSLLRRTGEDKLSSDDFFSLVGGNSEHNKWGGLPREVPFVNRVSKYVRKVDCHDCLHAEKSPSFCSGSRHHFSYRQYTAPQPPRRAALCVVHLHPILV